jgi:hypothetical protein
MAPLNRNWAEWGRLPSFARNSHDAERAFWQNLRLEVLENSSDKAFLRGWYWSGRRGLSSQVPMPELNAVIGRGNALCRQEVMRSPPP